MDTETLARDDAASTEEVRPYRVVCGMPSGDMCFALTSQCWAAMFATSVQYGIDVRPGLSLGSMAPNNRSDLGYSAMAPLADGWEPDALLLFDPDMTFPPLGLAGLLAHGEGPDIIGATYQQRTEGGETHGFELDGSRIDCSRGGPLREVASIPCGFMLIRKRVLRALDWPLFRFPFEEGKRKSISEDYDMCRRARALGFKVWMDPELSLAMGHIGFKIYRIPRAVPGQPVPRETLC